MSVPPTPTLQHAATPNGVANGVSSASHQVQTSGSSRPTTGPLASVPPELAGLQIRPLPGPGGIIVRPGRGLMASRLPPHLQAAGLMDYGGGSRREMILRELEARKLYKVLEGRPMLGMPPMPPMPPVPHGMTATAGPVGEASHQNTSAQGASDDPRTVDAGTAGSGPASTLPMLPLQPAHGPHYWPYVDPASIFKDILG